MAQRLETITQHVFAFDDDEITTIIEALHAQGDWELADHIHTELHEKECDGCGEAF